MKANIVILLLVLCCLKLNAQDTLQINQTSLNYFDGVTEKECYIDKVLIINRSSEDYFTWISIVPIKNKSNSELIRDYFLKRKGDFNLLEMMYENLLCDKQDIGYSFIKNIASGSSFLYCISKKKLYSTFYRDRLVFISKKEVERCLRQSLKELHFYPYTDIFLLEK
jgi:hypothetical protein